MRIAVRAAIATQRDSLSRVLVALNALTSPVAGSTSQCYTACLTSGMFDYTFATTSYASVFRSGANRAIASENTLCAVHLPLVSVRRV
jgi:hypothetical protein